MAFAARVALLALLLLTARLAHAQYSVPSEASGAQRIGSARSKIREELVRPGGWEVGTSLSFMRRFGNK